MQDSLLTSDLLEITNSNNVSEYFDAKTKVGDINKKISWIITHKRQSELALVASLTTHKSVSVRRKLAEAFRVLGLESDITILQNWLEIEADRQTYVSI